MFTEARLEIINPSGHVEDRVCMYGPGEVGVSTTDRRFRGRATECEVVVTLQDAQAIALFDEVVLFDSSLFDTVPRLFARFEAGVAVARYHPLPPWCSAVLAPL